MSKMNVGIIGAGMISQAYIPSLCTQFPWLKVAAISDVISGKAEERLAQMKEQGIPNIEAIQIYTTEDMLERKDVQIVIVLTPVESHYSVIKSALLAGKHVYTEKTICQNTQQAAELAAIAAEKGLWFGSAPDTFLGTTFQTARKALDDGIIGEVNSFSISVSRCNDIMMAYFPFLRTAGGLRDYSVYYLTALVSLLGPVKKVSAFVRCPYPKRMNNMPHSQNCGEEIETAKESVISAILELENGIVGTFHHNDETVLNDCAEFSIYGKHGILKPGCPNLFDAETSLVTVNMETYQNESKVLPQVGAYVGNSRGVGVAEMAESIQANRLNRANHQMAAHVLEVIEAMEKSSAEGITVQIESTCQQPAPMPNKLEG